MTNNMVTKKIIATLLCVVGVVGMMFFLWAGIGGGLDVSRFWICTALMMACCGVLAWGSNMWEKIIERQQKGGEL